MLDNLSWLDLEALKLVLNTAVGNQPRCTQSEWHDALRRVQTMRDDLESNLEAEAEKRQKHYLLVPPK